MNSMDYEADLNEHERAVKETVHRFAKEVMQPAGVALDALHDPADVIAKDSVLWDVFAKHRALGLEELMDPSSGLTLAEQARLRCIITEELGWGDSGLAIAFGVRNFPRFMAETIGRLDLVDQFAGDDCIGCWAGTEPDHGSDLIYYITRPPNEQPGRPNCLARKEGDFFVIDGQKSAWVSNGTIANCTAMFCAVDMGDGVRRDGGFLMRLDLPGVTKGKPLDKIGQRALNQGEIFFDNVRVPANAMVIDPDAYAMGTDMILCMANSGMGSIFTGVAQAAFDFALDYAKQRVQGGRPIFEHQAVKARLFDMFRKVQASRAISRQAMLYNVTHMPPRLEVAAASKVTATNNAFEVASSALQIFGGNGLSREYPIEKLLRDARASMIEDGCNDILGLSAAENF